MGQFYPRGFQVGHRSQHMQGPFVRWLFIFYTPVRLAYYKFLLAGSSCELFACAVLCDKVSVTLCLWCVQRNHAARGKHFFPKNSLRMSRSWGYVPPRRTRSAAHSLGSALRVTPPLSRSPLSKLVSLRRALAPQHSCSAALSQQVSLSRARALSRSRSPSAVLVLSSALAASLTSWVRVRPALLLGRVLDAQVSSSEYTPPPLTLIIPLPPSSAPTGTPIWLLQPHPLPPSHPRPAPRAQPLWQLPPLPPLPTSPYSAHPLWQPPSPTCIPTLRPRGRRYDSPRYARKVGYHSDPGDRATWRDVTVCVHAAPRTTSSTPSKQSSAQAQPRYKPLELDPAPRISAQVGCILGGKTCRLPLPKGALPAYQVVDALRNPLEHQGRRYSFSRYLDFLGKIYHPYLSPFFIYRILLHISWRKIRSERQYFCPFFWGKNLAQKQHFSPFFRCDFVAFRVDLRLRSPIIIIFRIRSCEQTTEQSKTLERNRNPRGGKIRWKWRKIRYARRKNLWKWRNVLHGYDFIFSLIS